MPGLLGSKIGAVQQARQPMPQVPPQNIMPPPPRPMQEASYATAYRPMQNMQSVGAASLAPPGAARYSNNPYTALRPNIRAGLAGSKYSSYINPMTNPDQGGVVPGQAPKMNAVEQAQMQGPSLAEIQAEMKRREVGAQLNANPANSALAGYMMGQ